MQKNKYFYQTILGCMIFCFGSAFAYTSADCENASRLASNGIITYQSSCPGYALDRNITRAEVAAVGLKIAETCGALYETWNTCEGIYCDVTSTDPNTWACRAAETLARNGIISLNTQSDGFNHFYPTRNITRAEALAIILKSGKLDFQNSTYNDWRFNGTGANSWQKPLMQYAFNSGYITSINGF